PQNDVTLKMPAFEWVHVQLHQQKGMISLSPPTICNSASGNIGANPATACNDTHRRGLMGYHPVVHLAYKMSPTGLTSFLGIKRS
ncbi:hypothetical protein ML319_23830, partial [Escherichia coli]|uniref:hypothetical protein n=1 Tax=Escherichia coli TaxID=562 RepID=UPI001F0EFCC5